MPASVQRLFKLQKSGKLKSIKKGNLSHHKMVELIGILTNSNGSFTHNNNISVILNDLECIFKLLSSDELQIGQWEILFLSQTSTLAIIN